MFTALSILVADISFNIFDNIDNFKKIKYFEKKIARKFNLIHQCFKICKAFLTLSNYTSKEFSNNKYKAN